MSLFALFISLFDSKENRLQNRKSNKKAEKALRLSQGSTELGIRSSISEGRTRFNTFVFEFKKLQLEYPEADLSGFANIMNVYLEDLLSLYDTACVLYLDKKIDRKRFKKHFMNEIVNSVENPNYREEYFNSEKVKFSGIVEVYEKWTGSKVN